jgi:hypothetical protein
MFALLFQLLEQARGKPVSVLTPQHVVAEQAIVNRVDGKE